MYVNVYHLSARHDTVHLPVVAVAVPFSTSVALLRRNTYPRMDTNTGPRARAEAHRPFPEQYRTLQNRSDQNRAKPSSAELGQCMVSYRFVSFLLPLPILGGNCSCTVPQLWNTVPLFCHGLHHLESTYAIQYLHLLDNPNKYTT